MDFLFDDADNNSSNNNNSNNNNKVSETKPQPNNITSEEQARQDELVDIQKELEAKFDELFGSIDE